MVEKGTTLRHLSLLYLERYDLPTLARLCAFNGVSDPNQIEIGQTVRIPLSLRRPVVRLGARSGERSAAPSINTAQTAATDDPRETRP